MFLVFLSLYIVGRHNDKILGIQ
eukprot:COSAG01_NODE_35624_length_529_cov_0.951163_1_plen_22_part_10